MCVVICGDATRSLLRRTIFAYTLVGSLPDCGAVKQASTSHDAGCKGGAEAWTGSMGGLCGSGHTSEFHTQFVVEYNRFATLLSRLRLSQLEARQLYTFFRSIDADGSGSITIEEFKTRVK